MTKAIGMVVVRNAVKNVTVRTIYHGQLGSGEPLQREHPWVKIDNLGILKTKKPRPKVAKVTVEALTSKSPL